MTSPQLAVLSLQHLCDISILTSFPWVFDFEVRGKLEAMYSILNLSSYETLWPSKLQNSLQRFLNGYAMKKPVFFRIPNNA